MTSADIRSCQVPHASDARDVLSAARVDPERGLTAAEAADRLARWGRNIIRSAPTVPMWRRVLAQFQDPLVYLLGVAIVISGAAWWVEGRDGLPVDAIVITAILLANATIGLAQQAKADDAVAALARMTEANSTVIRDGLLIAVPSSELVPGDLLALGEGDAVGADARLLRATRLKVHEASLTGESAPVVKDPGTLPPDTPLADRTNMVHKGTAVVEGVGRAVVTGTGMATEVGTIADLLDSTAAETSPLERELAQVSKTLGLLVVGIAVLVMAAMWVVTGADTPDRFVTILLTGVSLAVAAVPEGLVAILSLVLAVGVRAMAARGALVKDPHSVETLGSTSVICSDKTGTLTRNEMTLRRIVTASGSVDLSGSGYVPQGDAELTPDTPNDQGYAATLAEARAVLVGGVVANNAQLSRQGQDWAIQGDPTEGAFLVAQHKLGDVAARCAAYRRRGEIPFTSARKLMSVVAHHPGRGEHRIYTKGAPDVLLTRCTSVRVGTDVVPLDASRRQAIEADIDALSAEGFRTLGVGYRVIPDCPAEEQSHSDAVGPGSGGTADGRLDVEAPGESAESELTFVGVVGIIDPPRDQVPAAVAEARRAGIRPIMITGDHPGTAQRIATDLGITTSDRAALSGNDIDRLDDSELAAAVRATDVFARVSPAHKLRIVDALQADQHTVAMTGDGVNDAPALKSADIGIAMGITGTEVTKEAATMILGDDNFATIVAAVRAGRVIYANIAKFLRYLLSSNLGEVFTVFAGVLFASALGLTDTAGATLVPLLATQILWINLVTDAAPALALGVDPEIDDVMLRPPRPRSARILDGPAWRRIGWVGVLMGLVTLLTLDLLLPGGLVEGTATIEVARTAGFTTLVLAQLLNAFAVRSRSVSAWRGAGSNRWLLAACGFGVLAQVAVVHVPALQGAFATAPLSAGQWSLCAGMASVVLLSQELAKAAGRARR